MYDHFIIDIHYDSFHNHGIIDFLILNQIFFSGKRCVGSPVLHGMCEKIGKKMTGFTFNSKTAKCEHFATIGCKLSENGFKSKEMCQRACKKGDYHRNVKSRNANQ